MPHLRAPTHSDSSCSSSSPPEPDLNMHAPILIVTPSRKMCSCKATQPHKNNLLLLLRAGAPPDLQILFCCPTSHTHTAPPRPCRDMPCPLPPSSNPANVGDSGKKVPKGVWGGKNTGMQDAQ